MNRSDKRLRLCLCLIAGNLLFIWGNSLLPGEISGAISDAVKAFLSALLPDSGLESAGGGLIRKLAHLTEFACLGALLAWLSEMLGKRPLNALLPCIAAACADETIQRFVPGRGPSLRDVLIDSGGALLGIGLLLLGYRCYSKRKKGKNSL